MLTTLDCIQNKEIETGEILISVAVSAAHIVNDIRENIRNLVGGRMSHYENLIESASARALKQLGEKAKEKGYDGVLGVRLSHPYVADGAVEVIAYGTGFTYSKKKTDEISDAGNSGMNREFLKTDSGITTGDEK